MLGLGDLTWDLGRQTYLADHVPHQARARVMTTFGGVLRIGRVIGPALGALVLSLSNIETVFVIHLVAAGLSIVAVVVFVTPTLRSAESAEPSNRTDPRRTTDAAEAFRPDRDRRSPCWPRCGPTAIC